MTTSPLARLEALAEDLSNFGIDLYQGGAAMDDFAERARSIAATLRAEPVVGECANVFRLEFHPASEHPTEEGDYALYNQCDGYNLASAWFDADGFMGFYTFSSYHIPTDGYCAWAMLPESHTKLFDLFAEKEPAALPGLGG